MRFGNGNGRRRLTINITSLIDVLFLLLIFVLVTAQFEDVGAIQVDLPKGKSRALPEQKKNVVLSITRKGEYYIDTRKVEPLDLRKEFETIAKRDKDTVLEVKGDASVPYEKVIAAVGEARDVGLEKVAFRLTVGKE
ncbi:MAG: ExbD/TolR family protein [Planctomycetota bacterium]|jgi:biopolymer transport protein ExbD